MSDKVQVMNLFKDVLMGAVTDTENGFKIHVAQIGTSQFEDIAQIIQTNNVNVQAKRSGTGITLIVVVND